MCVMDDILWLLDADGSCFDIRFDICAHTGQSAPARAAGRQHLARSELTGLSHHHSPAPTPTDGDNAAGKADSDNDC